jgi:hypothetical protein
MADVGQIGVSGEQSRRCLVLIQIWFTYAWRHSFSITQWWVNYIFIFTDNLPNMLINIQLMTFHEVNTRIDQPMEHAIHRGRLAFRNDYIL